MTRDPGTYVVFHHGHPEWAGKFAGLEDAEGNPVPLSEFREEGTGTWTAQVTAPTVETVMEWLHDLDGTQHFITHGMNYDGEDEEGVECITGVEGHRDDALQLLAALSQGAVR